MAFVVFGIALVDRHERFPFGERSGVSPMWKSLYVSDIRTIIGLGYVLPVVVANPHPTMDWAGAHVSKLWISYPHNNSL